MQQSLLLSSSYHHASLLLAALAEPHGQIFEQTDAQQEPHCLWASPSHQQLLSFHEMQYGRASQGIF
jgi:hypothetical protein